MTLARHSCPGLGFGWGRVNKRAEEDIFCFAIDGGILHTGAAQIMSAGLIMEARLSTRSVLASLLVLLLLLGFADTPSRAWPKRYSFKDRHKNQIIAAAGQCALPWSLLRDSCRSLLAHHRGVG